MLQNTLLIAAVVVVVASAILVAGYQVSEESKPDCPYDCCRFGPYKQKTCPSNQTCWNHKCAKQNCPYECCTGETYKEKFCQQNLSCLNNQCIFLECPYECCANEPNYQDKACQNDLICQDNNCVELPLPECPYECCEDEQYYLDKECQGNLICENNECVGESQDLTPCPYECCAFEPGHKNKLCKEPLACAEHECLLPPCPFECCLGDYYEEEECRDGLECINYECIDTNAGLDQNLETCPYECCFDNPPYEDKNCSQDDLCIDNECITIPPEMSEAEQLGKAFFDEKMIGSQGGVYCTYRTGWPPEPYACANHKFGSERTGLALLYYTLAPDRTQFLKQKNFVETYLLSEHDLLYWKLDEDYSHDDYQASASLDDLRVIQALLLEYQRYGNQDDYDLAMQLADGVKTYETVNNQLTQGASWDGDGVYTDDDLYLSYANLRAMDLIAQYDSDWQSIKENTASIVAAGSYGNSLFHEMYDYSSQQYSEDTTLNSIHQATIGLNLTAYNTSLAQQNLDFWKAEWHEDNHIASSYTPDGEDACTWCDDFSVYALVARLAHELGDTEFEEEMIDAITALQITDNPASEFYGCFTWDTDYAISSYGNSLALIALATQRSG